MLVREEHQTAKFDDNMCVIYDNGFETVADRVNVTRGLTNLMLSKLHSRDEVHEYLTGENEAELLDIESFSVICFKAICLNN